MKPAFDLKALLASSNVRQLGGPVLIILIL